jgi:hypothetical protein
MRQILPFILVSVVSSALSGTLSILLPPPAVAEESISPSMESLNQLNASFRARYTNAKREIRENLGPVIFVSGDQMTLINKGAKKSERFIPEGYTYFKDVDHIPLACYVTLVNKTNRTLTAEETKDLSTFADSIRKARTTLSGTVSGDKKELARQQFLVQLSLDFLSETVENGKVTHDQLQSFARAAAPESLQNIDNAIALQLAKMQEITDKWRSELAPDEWEKLHVILTTGHMPRRHLSAFQFFCDYLNEKEEGKRVIVMEGVDTEEAGLDLLVTHILDGHIAVDFFNEPWIMHSDLLSGGAHAWLKKHKVRPARSRK